MTELKKDMTHMQNNPTMVDDSTKVLGKVWTTPRDKEIWIRKTVQYGFFEISMAGEKPKELSGRYTKPTDAEKAIEKYLSVKESTWPFNKQ